MSWFKGKEPTWFQIFACKVLQCGKIPRHVAFILDGNRRFAKKHSVEKIKGHDSGFETLTDTLDWCRHLGIVEVTVYAFSIENFKRSRDEVDGLMDLARKKFQELLKEKDKVMENGIRVRVIGNISMLPADLQKLIAEVHLLTENNDRAKLNIALAYTSRDEATNAVNEVLWGAENEMIRPEDIDESVIESCFYTSKSEHPDLLIRTSGEVRLSDFLVWQTAYSCLHFTPVLWPEFSFWELCKAVIHYQAVYPTIQEARQVKENKHWRENQKVISDPGRSERVQNFLSNREEKEQRHLKALMVGKSC